MYLINGIRVICAPWALYPTKESFWFRKPKSKKKRIMNKFKRNPENFKIITVNPKAMYDTQKRIIFLSQKDYDSLINETNGLHLPRG